MKNARLDYNTDEDIVKKALEFLRSLPPKMKPSEHKEWLNFPLAARLEAGERFLKRK